MANQFRVNVARQTRVITKLLQSTEMQAVLAKVADEIKDEVQQESDTQGSGNKYETEVYVNAGRAGAIVRSRDQKAPYSEAKHGYLSRAAHKDRRIIS